MKIIDFLKSFSSFSSQNKNSQNYCKKNKLDSHIIDYKTKEVSVIGLDNTEYKIKQFCKHVEKENIVLISGTVYDTNSKIYHKYYDCYEDWPTSHDFKFSKWKLADINKLNGYSECNRCFERDYRNSHPNLRMTGCPFNYYYENLK